MTDGGHPLVQASPRAGIPLVQASPRAGIPSCTLLSPSLVGQRGERSSASEAGCASKDRVSERSVRAWSRPSAPSCPPTGTTLPIYLAWRRAKQTPMSKCKRTPPPRREGKQRMPRPGCPPTVAGGRTSSAVRERVWLTGGTSIATPSVTADCALFLPALLPAAHQCHP